MTRIIISGCFGKMGKIIAECVKEMPDCEVVGGIDVCDNINASFPVYKSALDINIDADVIIDFSNPAALKDLISFCSLKKMPLVLCTTGFSKSEINNIHEASKKFPIFYSGNMSLGINLIIELAKKAASVFGKSADIEIIEKHHNQKIDAPSGTALMIADAISKSSEEDYQYVYDRHSYRRARNKNEIGIHSVRGGTIVGEHEVIFASHDELLTISHSAQSKEIFAVGSINAAKYLSKKPAGLYNMSDMLSEK